MFRKLSIFLSFVALFFLFYGVAGAATSDLKWYPTDTDVNVFDVKISPWVSGNKATADFVLHDFNNEGASLTVFSQDDTESGTVHFKNDGSWKASLNENMSDSIDLGDTKFFDFYAKDGSIDDDYDWKSLGGNQYGINFNEGTGTNIDMKVSMTDASPVPLPGAAWILGAGLLGLIGIRRRSSK